MKDLEHVNMVRIQFINDWLPVDQLAKINLE